MGAMRQIRLIVTNWRVWLIAVVCLIEWLLTRWAGGIDRKAWAPSIGANLGTMLVTVFGVEYLVKRESRKKAEGYLRMTLLQVGSVIGHVMGATRAPDIFPPQIVNSSIRFFVDLADALERQRAFVDAELDLETRAQIKVLEDRLRSTGGFCTAAMLTTGQPASIGFLLHTWWAYRSVWESLYPRATVTLVPTGDQLLAEVESRWQVKYSEMPPMDLS